MAKKKKKKSKSLFKRIGVYIINITVFLLILCYGIPLSMYTGRFYGALLKHTQQKTRTYSKTVRTYHVSYQGSKYHY